jgi:hypothetical protein
LQQEQSLTVESMLNILIQIVATEKNSRQMYDYPEKSEIAEEYYACKRFWDLHGKNSDS